jgi:ligand-binding sensor domain-containing protein
MLVLLATFSIKAQIYSFQTLGLEDGLPSNQINDFIQDSRGFYWLATEGTGLVRYDGYDFVTYREASQPERLLVSEVKEDAAGNIWAALENGLLRFDGREFYDFLLPDGIKVRHFALSEESILISSQNNQLWELHNEQWKPLSLPNDISVNDIEIFGNEVWVASDQGLFKTSKTTEFWERLDSMVIYHLSFDEKYLYASSNHEIIGYESSGVKKSTRKEKVLFLQAGENGYSGLNNDELLLSWNTEPLHLGEENGFPQKGFTKVYTDNFGVVWLFGGEGMAKLESQSLKTITDFSERANHQVNAVKVLDNGALVGGFSSGLVVLKDSILKVKDAKNGFPFGLTLAIEEFDQTRWYGTEAGLIKEKNNQYVPVNLPYPGDFVFALKKAKNALWIGLGSGLLSYANGRFERTSEKYKLPAATVFSISEAKRDNSLWCATYTQGFYRLHNDNWEVIRELNGNRLDSLRFSCFTAISKNEIWAGSLTEGIFHFTEKGVEHISPEQLNFAEILSIETDDYGNIWVGTNKGLMQIDPNQNIFSIPFPGSLSRVSSSPQAIGIQGDQLLMGASEGIQVIDLSSYLVERQHPGIVLTDVKMFLGEQMEWRRFAEDSLPFTQVPSELTLPHDLNFLSFNLSGLSSFNADRLQYRYRLSGQSDEWAYAGNRKEAILSNIKPGNYVFEAQATRLGEEWGTESVTYPFKILRPVWERWWFITLLILVIGSLITLFIYDRVRRVNQRLKLENELIEMERKALRLQMNPHFIFNALDSISSFIFKNDPRKAVQYLNNFAKLMRLTLESSMEHIHPVETEVSILKNYLELEKLRFQGKFDYEIELDEEIDYDVGIPPMLIQPHVENAILHGLKPMESDGQLDIRFILEEEMLEIQIEDNGVGRKRAKELKKRKDHRSMATKINKDRLRLLKMAVNQNIEIRILDKEDEQGNALGTKVILKLPAENI